MFLDKDLPIIGQHGLSPVERRLLTFAVEGMLERIHSFPWQSLILDAKGKPFSQTRGETIVFRRYNPFTVSKDV